MIFLHMITTEITLHKLARLRASHPNKKISTSDLETTIPYTTHGLANQLLKTTHSLFMPS